MCIRDRNATVETNQMVLDFNADQDLVSEDVEVVDSVIIPPCYIGENVKISRSVIGPHVSIHSNTSIEGSVIENSIVYGDSSLKNVNFSNSMVGNFVTLHQSKKDLSIGDYSKEIG